MTTTTVRPKQILAREILLFFCGLGLLALIWGFLALRDTYYNHKANSYSDEVKSLQHQLDTLPTDYLKEFYDLTSKYFVVNYKLGKDTYAIPKEQEKDFLTDEYGITKNVTYLPVHPTGFSYFKQHDPLKILDKDSTIVFDYVTFDKFREFATSEDYQNKLFSVFSNSPDQDGTVTVNSLIDKPKFDPMKPYNGIFDLGTLQHFKDQIKKGLNYNDKLKETKKNISEDIALKQKSVNAARDSTLDAKEMNKILVIALIVIGIVLYPLRLSVYSINWAVKTLRQKN
jgi:hypothetical protein